MNFNPVHGAVCNPVLKILKFDSCGAGTKYQKFIFLFYSQQVINRCVRYMKSSSNVRSESFPGEIIVLCSCRLIHLYILYKYLHIIHQPGRRISVMYIYRGAPCDLAWFFRTGCGRWKTAHVVPAIRSPLTVIDRGRQLIVWRLIITRLRVCLV